MVDQWKTKRITRVVACGRTVVTGNSPSKMQEHHLGVKSLFSVGQSAQPYVYTESIFESDYPTGEHVKNKRDMGGM